MPRALQNLEAEALNLPEEERIHLIQRLLRSLQAPTGSDAVIAREWAEEAERRDVSLDRGDSGSPADEVFQRIESARQ